MNLLFISYLSIYSCLSGCGFKSEDTLNHERVTDSFTLSDYFTSSELLDKKTDSLFNRLSDYERIGQMIVVCGGNLGKPREEISALISGKKAGGVLLLGGTKEELKKLINEFKTVAENSGALPLIFSTDGEPSLINNKIYNVKKFNPTGSISSSDESYIIAGEISEILSEIGFNQNYAPVCDFPFNSEVIGNRSFGKNPEELAGAFVKATQEKGIIATAKHFPGHGNVKGDSHKSPVFIDGELPELEVFRHVISSGVISVMIGHISIRNNEKYNTGGLPSTLSGKIIKGLLREELSFRGIIVTDAMNMKAVSKIPQQSLKAVIAGCDMILMPPDEEELITSVIKKINSDPELKEQVYSSVKRIIRAKICLGLIK
ncbi:MAG: glycoside hydrolase family 3 protein [Ignavibacteria bacterium]|nr:glycoside hydrolase family 3 protein [Ignavibacteria bacterium]